MVEQRVCGFLQGEGDGLQMAGSLAGCVDVGGHGLDLSRRVKDTRFPRTPMLPRDSRLLTGEPKRYRTDMTSFPWLSVPHRLPARLEAAERRRAAAGALTARR
jgi:hypothetical protein